MGSCMSSIVSNVPFMRWRPVARIAPVTLLGMAWNQMASSIVVPIAQGNVEFMNWKIALRSKELVKP